MFDLLKKKIGGFIDGLVKKEEAKPESIPERKPEPKPEPELETKTEPKPEPRTEPRSPSIPKTEPKKEKKAEPEPNHPKPVQKPERNSVVTKPAHGSKPDVKSVPKPTPGPEPKPEPRKAGGEPEPPKPERKEEKKEGAKESQRKDEPKKDEKKPLVKLGLPSRIIGLVTGEVTISESEVKGMLDDFELELLESDVDMQVAEDIKGTLKSKLVGAKVKKSALNRFMQDSVAETLKSIILDSDFDLVEYIRNTPKPVKVMLLGTNGAGKTTTIAKLTHLLQKNGFKVALCAADTFRAAAIEQLNVHADRLGVRIIKRDYGADPTAVAFDGVSYAKAHGLDVVLIDTAGRQETNYNLVNELKKMNRVIQPELKIYIGESIAGNSIIEQVSAFNQEIGVNGVILTKIDCDAKGGTVISISKATGVPIYYLGTGQGYDDLEPFDKGRLVERIVG